MPLASGGLNCRLGWPLNQNGAPAASTLPATVPAGATSGSGLPPLAGKSTVWNWAGLNLTESPAWIVVPCGKKSLTSAPTLLSVFSLPDVGPIVTTFVAALALAGIASTAAAAANAALDPNDKGAPLDRSMWFARQ